MTLKTTWEARSHIPRGRRPTILALLLGTALCSGASAQQCTGDECGEVWISGIHIDAVMSTPPEDPDEYPEANELSASFDGKSIHNSYPNGSQFRQPWLDAAPISAPKGKEFYFSFRGPSGWATSGGVVELFFQCGTSEIEVEGELLSLAPGGISERIIGGFEVDLSPMGCMSYLRIAGTEGGSLVGSTFRLKFPGENSCDKPSPPSYSGDGLFQGSTSSGSDDEGVSAGAIQWKSASPSAAVDPSVWAFTGGDLGLGGVTDVTFGNTRQIKTATQLTDMTRSGDVLAIRKFGVEGIGTPDGNGLHSTTGLDLLEEGIYEMSETIDPMTSGILTSHLQVAVTRGEETVVWHELDYDAAAGRREWTDHLAGTRGAVIAGETLAGQRTGTREEFRHSPSEQDFVLVSRVTDVFEEFAFFLTSGERLVETIVDPGGANLVTAFQYEPYYGERTVTRYPDGSWSSRTDGGIAADGELDLNEFPGVTGDIVSVTYRPWLDSALPGSGVPDAALCVAELEIDMTEDDVSFTRRETWILGEITSRVDTWTEYQTEDGTFCDIGYTRTWNSMEAGDFLVRQTWTYQPSAGIDRTYKTVGEDGGVRRHDHAKGTWSAMAGFSTDAGGSFFRTREWDTAEITGGSTRTVRVEDGDGRTVEEQFEVWTGSAWDTMSTDRWIYDDEHADGKVTEHFKEGILVGRSAETATTGTDRSAGGPLVTTVRGAGGETLSVLEDYPAPMEDIVTTYTRDGRKEITTRQAGGLSETTVTGTDLAGRVVSTTDERGITTLTAYSDGGRTVTNIRPGGVTEISTSYLDGRRKSTSGSGVIPTFTSYSVDGNGFLSTTGYTGTADATSPRWITTVSDWSGRTVTITRPSPTLSGTVTETRHYHEDTGRLEKISFPGSADRLFVYDDLGRVTLSGLDLDADGVLTLASTDRISQTVRSYVELGGQWWDQTTTSTWHTNGNGTAAYTSTHRAAVAPEEEDGAARWTTVTIHPGGLTHTTHRDEFFSTSTVIESTGSSATTASPDSVITFVAGRLTSATGYGATQATTFAHDALGRQTLVTDPRGGTTRTIYNAAGQPARQIDHARNVTLIDWYPPDHQSAGLQRRVSNPELESTEYAYDLLGRVTAVTGSGTYPLSYGYSTYGELETLVTHASGGAGDTTTWLRDPATGVLLEKVYPDNNKTAYTYHSSGQVHTRAWQRGVTTTYSYNNAGDLTGIDHSDATPDVAIVPDRLGRPHGITDGGGEMTRSYHPDLPVETTDAHDSGHSWLPGVTVDRAWNPATAQRLHTGAKRGGTWDQKAEVLHDPVTGRLEKITGPAFAHRYDYAPGTSLITGITHRNAADTATMASEIRRTDLTGKLYAIETRDAANNLLQRHAYRHDKAGRRVRATREDGAYWAYAYNKRGEVTSGKKHLPDATPLAGHQFEYQFDALGNREWAKSGGDASGENLRTTTYDTNALNQYTEIQTPGTFDVIGRAPVADTITVNSAATQRQGDRFRAELTAANDYTAIWQAITVSNGTPPDIAGSRYVPKATVAPVHDADGNLLFDGRWEYSWDAENRLVSMANQTPTANHRAPGEPFRKLLFSYDWMGRRVSKQVFGGTVSSPTLLEDLRFAYDGWNLIAEYTASGSTLTLLRGYTWGTDLSGSDQGAGGVGGLLAVSIVNPQSSIDNFTPSYDGNGNITGWVNTSGELAATQEFDPFGNKIIREGSLDLPFGFSTKYRDKETGLLYYGYRYLDTVDGRWKSRDPIEELGGVNVYGFSDNSSVNCFDVLGKAILCRENQSQGFSEDLEKAFEILTGGEFHWEKWDGGGQDRYLCIDKDGSGELWETLKIALKGKNAKNVRIIYMRNTATGNQGLSTVYIDHKIKLAQWVLKGGDVDPPLFFDNPPELELSDTLLPEALWHELAGHVLAATPSATHHSLEKWNFYNEGKVLKPGRHTDWGRKFDEAIMEENKARKVLRKSRRAPWYYGLPSRKGIDY